MKGIIYRAHCLITNKDYIGLKSAAPICEILNGSPRRKTAGKYKGSKVGWTKVNN